MIDIASDLHTALQEIKRELEVVKQRLFLLEVHREEEVGKQEVIERKLRWLDENDKEHEMQIDNITRRISNDFPTAPWEDD
ncbi:MAG: hypothetical protein SF029_14420 [bacterium]|nr:hypothetical protein [bacterium]